VVAPRASPRKPSAKRAAEPQAIRPLPFVGFADAVLRLRLTTAQFVYGRVAFDGVDPIDLPEELRPIALDLFGGAERIPSAVRRILVLRAGRASGKTLLAAAYSVWRMAYADLGQCGPGDKPTAFIVSPRVSKQSRIAFRDAKEFCDRAAGVLGWTLVAASADSLEYTRGDGATVAFESAAKSKGGDAIRGFSIISLIVDESEYIAPNDPGSMVSDGEIIAAAIPRLIKGSSAILISTPWPAESTTSVLFDKNFGAPSTALVARAPTVTMRDNDPDVVAMVAAERERDPSNALREFDCILSDVAGMFFETNTIDRAVLAGATFVPTGRHASAGMDLAFRHDSSGLIVVERSLGIVAVTRVELERPSPGSPLVPSVVITFFAKRAREVGASTCATDQHYIETAIEHGSKAGMTVLPALASGEQRDKAFLYLRDLLREGRLALPNDSRLIHQLRSVSARPKPGGGLGILLPRTIGNGHADLVSALIQAVWLDRRFGLITTPHDNVTPLRARQGMRPDALFATGSVFSRF